MNVKSFFLISIIVVLAGSQQSRKRMASTSA